MGSDLPPSHALQRTARVIENVPVARDTFRMRLDAPEIARIIRPGQFLMVRPGLGGSSDPLLGRPFALYDVARDSGGEPVAVDVVYITIGRGTQALAAMRPGDRVSAWGPLGNGFGPPPAGENVAFVAGGIGQTPFLALARWWLGTATYAGELIKKPAASATIFYGVRDSGLLAGVDDFRAAGMAVHLATDDGSAGHHGFVTDLLAAQLDAGASYARVVGCGPAPMLGALQKLAATRSLACDLSLENHMACGFGACFSCVAPIRQPDGSIDLKRVCVEGPIFPAQDVVLSAGGH